MTTTTEEARILTPVELATLIRTMRDLRKWSQEVLADIAGITPRTVQRVEAAEPSSEDTRRALAAAFDAQDIDIFNKPFAIPDPEALKAQQEAFEKNHLTLTCTAVTTGKALAKFSEASGGDVSTEAIELEGEAAGEFAVLMDAVRDYRDCSDLYSEVDKLDVYAQFQDTLDSLEYLGVTIGCATRKVRLRSGSADTEGIVTTILYMVAFPKEKVPKEIIVAKAISMGSPH